MNRTLNLSVNIFFNSDSKYKNPKNSSKSNELCREPNDSREISAQENAKTFRKGSMGANPQGTDIFKKIGS